MFEKFEWEGRRPRILGIGGTLRDGSRSRAALAAALRAAEKIGAETEMQALNDLRLPMFWPGRPLKAYPEEVHRLLAVARRSDGMIWSTAGYHGTVTGATKNALDFFEFLADASYLDGRPVGLIATAGGDMAAVNAIDAMVHVVHALRGTALPLKVPIGQARHAIDGQGRVRDEKAQRRLEMLGRLVVEQAQLRSASSRVAA